MAIISLVDKEKTILFEYVKPYLKMKKSPKKIIQVILEDIKADDKSFATLTEDEIINLLNDWIRKENSRQNETIMKELQRIINKEGYMDSPPKVIAHQLKLKFPEMSLENALKIVNDYLQRTSEGGWSHENE